ncbi:MAG TPA: hypothetical protein VIW73_00615 [Candidatus Cybelea sp.]
MLRFVSTAAVAAILAATGTALAATTPKPSASPHAVHTPAIQLPTVPLHTEVVVEVNKKGQVVRVKSTKQSKSRTFNLQTIGNAEQMWIRRPDGTAQVGLYRVTYDYDPKTKLVARHVALVSAGGSWGDQPGAATMMINLAHKQAIEQAKLYQEQQKKQQEQNAKLPSLNQIRGAHSPSPSPKSATLPP